VTELVGFTRKLRYMECIVYTYPWENPGSSKYEKKTYKNFGSGFYIRCQVAINKTSVQQN